MSGNRKDPKELLVELEYGELDDREATAAQAVIDDDPELFEMQKAIRAVRENLAAWDEVEPRPARITFVTMPRRGMATMGRDLMSFASRSVWTKAAAIAASFVFGILLSGAFFNLASDANPTAPDPGAATTTAPATRAPDAERTAPPRIEGAVPVMEGPGGFRVMTPAELESLVDNRLHQRGLVGDRPFLSARGDLDSVLTQLRVERETQIRALAREIVVASEQRQREEIDDLLAGVYQTFEAQRTNDLLFLASELGLLQENTGLELQRTQAAIDYLITIANERRTPEERDDD